MAADVRRIYWDANNFIYGLDPESNRARVLAGYLSRSASGELEIVTSNLTIAEVAFSPTEYQARALDSVVAEDIRALLTDPQRVQVIPLTNAIAFDAQAFVRAGMAARRAVKPADAIHLATAVHARVDALQTYDKRLVSAARELGIIEVEEL